MADPLRIKNKTEINIKGVFTVGETSSEEELSLIANKDKLTETPEENLREKIKQDLQIVRLTPLSAIYTTQMAFQYDNPDALKDCDYGNIFVEAHLPYCLHIPNHYELEVDLPELGIKALLIHRKIWTKKAQEGAVKSSEIDFFSEDKTTYFNNSVILTPKVPVDFDDGWEQDFTGRNIERMKDQNGTFRYSALYIQFDKTTSVQELANRNQLEKVIDDVKETALTVVNKLIDSYRGVTRNGFVQRLGTLEINTIYFIEHNKGFYILGSGFGIETATMNRSKNEITKIKEMLEKGEKPEIFDLLLLDAQTSLDNKDFTLAVVQSFQALEIFLENFLFKILLLRGDSEPDAVKYLDQHWRTKERLKECLRELKSTSLYEADEPLWNKWCTLYDQTRNEIVHKGKEPKQREVIEMLETNIKVIDWLKSL
ncbi:MAG: hypothetical protein ABI430_02095 [Candidatus Taylorbacteria bacterium]